MKYSIRLKEGWIGYYNRFTSVYGVTTHAKERIRCPYELAAVISAQLRQRGLEVRLQAELNSERSERF